MAIIEDIKWLDKNSVEAQVCIKSANGLCIDCYAFLFNGEVGDMVDCVLSTMDAEIDEYIAPKQTAFAVGLDKTRVLFNNVHIPLTVWR